MKGCASLECFWCEIGETELKPERGAVREGTWGAMRSRRSPGGSQLEERMQVEQTKRRARKSLHPENPREPETCGEDAPRRRDGRSTQPRRRGSRRRANATPWQGRFRRGRADEPLLGARRARDDPFREHDLEDVAQTQETGQGSRRKGSLGEKPWEPSRAK